MQQLQRCRRCRIYISMPLQADEEPADATRQRSKAAAKRARKKAAKQLQAAGTGSAEQLADSTAQLSVAEPGLV